MTSNVAVIGFGAWGAALAQHLASNGHKVTAWIRSEEFANKFSKDQIHKSFGTNQLSKEIKLTHQPLNLDSFELVVMAVPARALKEVSLSLKPSKPLIVVSAIKGIEPSTKKTPLQFLSTVENWNKCQLAVLSGPSFASDVVRARPVSLVCASKDTNCQENVSKIFASNAFRVYTSSDTIGVELGGIVKNVAAIAAGVCDALECGVSARAALITRGLAEMTRLAVALGAHVETLAGLSGLGDLVMTATENQSRNRTVGLRLGKGEQLDKIIESMGAEAEGVFSAKLVLELAKQNSVEVPITEAVVRLLKNEATPSQLIKELMSRPQRSEIR